MFALEGIVLPPSHKCWYTHKGIAINGAMAKGPTMSW
jgi:hypothetical protein